MNDTERQTIKTLLQKIKIASFSVGEAASDEDAMGLLISSYFSYKGSSILSVAANALEDSNFHGECKIVRDLLPPNWEND